MKLTINDKSISPMIFKVNQFSNVAVAEFNVAEINDNVDLWQTTPYLVTNGKSYIMSKAVLDSNRACLKLRLDNELTCNSAVFTYQIVLRDKGGSTVWYSNKGIFIVVQSLDADFDKPEQDKKEPESYGLFKGLLNEHIIGVPYLYKEVENDKGC